MKLKKIIIVGVTVISMFSIFLFMSKNNVLNNKIEENNVNKETENGIAVYVATDNDYERVDAIPENGYTYNEELSYCNESEVKNENIKISYDMNTKMISITPVANEKTKCYLYFDQDTAIARDYILAQITPNDGEPDFTKTATTDEGMYTAEDDDGTSYYYRGAVTNNYFYFGGYYWRIIRINGDGTLRLIYQGKSASSTGTNSQIGTSAFNSTATDNAYVGFKYTLNEQHGTGTDSTIKEVLDSWYTTNLASYAEFIADNGFCGDRTIDSGTGLGTETTYYAAYNRLYTNKMPSLKCSNLSDNIISKIGLITADEVSFAGSAYGSANANSYFYLYTGEYYWTISPATFINSNNYAAVFRVTTGGYLTFNNKVTGENGVRPVININKNVELEGTGTSSDPYKIKGTEIKVPTASETILANIIPKITTPDFSKVATTDEGVYAVSDGMYGGTSYYWRGAVTNNYVKFAGFCWRIIRINGDGSIRLIYDGTTCHANGTSTTDSIAVASQAYNSSYDSSVYVGWSYTQGEQHGIKTASNARTQVESWYDTNLASYGSYIATGKFCNDREIESGYTWSEAPSSSIFYAAVERLSTNKMPTLSCSNASDVFMVKIGLITADEVSYAGGVFWESNSSFYLYNGNGYWTMTPYSWFSDDQSAFVFWITSVGILDDYAYVSSKTLDLRPVINLKADITFSSGNGTQSSPYVVKTT